MAAVQSVVDRVGPTLLRLLHTPADCPAVGDVVIAEPDGGQLAAGDLVLGVATSAPSEAVALIEACAARQVAAVLLKAPLAGKAAIRRTARSTGIALVEVNTATSWAQLVWLLRTVLDAITDESDEREGDPVASDLFRLADAAAAVVDAPVTIEDTNSRVLAYSSRQDLTDPARVSTIMGRRIPDDVLTRFRSRGVFRELSRGHQTIFVPGQRDGTLPRLIVPIRMGGELLGSMWAVVTGPVSDERAAAFADAAPVVALHLLRRRTQVDADRRASAELLRGLLDGTVAARTAVTELGLAAEPHRVVVIDTEGGRGTSDGEALRLSLLERIAQGMGTRQVATELRGLLYAVVPDGEWPALREALADLPARGKIATLRVAAGGAFDVARLAVSRAQAEEALSLLRSGVVAGEVVSFGEAWPQLALHRAATVSTPARVGELGPLDSLREHDSAHGTEYVSTLYEWLRHPGDPRSAARALRIHPNTLRYRVRKLLELSSLDLDQPDVRLALVVQLVALRWN
ncbi:PucR family transcriptional regulator [Amycolatopsis antarctica]|uniref:PucR family transcriptional regulator n=1 Tax=Amycolatopsis antarctica TaxID=1854586 RepID=A0A263D6B9_9PSEU|nr:PucR family transcriptional regulator [Amycolatopsis antarctica]OZM73739.1 PucR family transcriptional regulator [Amycolatopsis antarctica]